MTRNTSTEPDNSIIGLSATATRDAARRKLAVGRAILREGPVSLARITALCMDARAPIEGPTWPTTLVRVRFLEAVPVMPRRWTLTPRGRAWVEAIIAGEQVIAAAKEVAT